MTAPTTEASLRYLLRRGQIPGPWHDDQVSGFHRACSEFIGQHGDEIAAVLAALRERPSPPEGADIDRMNNAADLIRRLLGYDGEPDESTAGMIYDAIEGDEDAFRDVLALAVARPDCPLRVPDYLAVIEWLRDNNPAALELCPYKVHGWGTKSG